MAAGSKHLSHHLLILQQKEQEAVYEAKQPEFKPVLAYGMLALQAVA